jgi:hypothetical protein
MRLATLSTLLALAACSKAPAPASTPNVPPAAAAAAAPAAPSGPGPRIDLDCARLFSKELLARHGLTGVTGKAPQGATVINCSLAGKDLLKVGVNCPSWGRDPKLMSGSLESWKKTLKGAKDLPGLGREASVGFLGGLTMLQFWDDDTACFVSLTAKDTAAAMALARDLVPALSPATLAP